MHSTKKGAAPIGATPEWSQVLLIFPSSTCSFNSIPYLSYKIVGGIVCSAAADGGFCYKTMISCITVFVDTMITSGSYEDKSVIF